MAVWRKIWQECITKGKYDEEYHAKYKLLVKNRVDLWFTRVKHVVNMYPAIFDEETLKKIKKSGFFSEDFIDRMIDRFNPDDYDPDGAAKIIADEFLLELLERRSTPEFKNIVFSIQRKQGEIIQAPYKRNMIVQGCAGSGKSMILMHRLPILLYDNPTSLSRTNLYIVTPSTMYIQLAENMRHQLEISDIKMGTIEQYYDHCIAKYSGHKEGDYGKISYRSRLALESEKYVYSKKCIEDINDFYQSIIGEEVSLDKAYEILKIRETSRVKNTMALEISARLLNAQKVIKENNTVLSKYFVAIKDVIQAFKSVSYVLRNRRDSMIREMEKMISNEEKEIVKAQREIEKYDKEKNSIAINNRKNLIEAARKKIIEYTEEKKMIVEDKEYFPALIERGERIDKMMEPFEGLKNEYGQNQIKDIYDYIDKMAKCMAPFSALYRGMVDIEDRYLVYLRPISISVGKVGQCLTVMNTVDDSYLPYNYCQEILDNIRKLSDVNSEGVKSAYEYIMGKIGIKKTENGYMRAIKCSPYIYLQALYCFRGTPDAGKETLLAVDEAQGFALEEIRLLKNVNGENVVFNLYGDIHQHIEGTKGVDDWEEYREIIDYDMHEMQENYRNASQITKYCNNIFQMNMNAINTPGKGVHELNSEEEFKKALISQLLDNQRAGLAAVIIGDELEKLYLLDEFSEYENKFHDLTEEEFSLHSTRWNIINIDDAKGLEFSSVIVLAGRMSRNQRYIAYTRALDELFVYQNVIDVKDYKKKSKAKDSDENSKKNKEKSNKDNDKKDGNTRKKHISNDVIKDHSNSKVREFFEKKGLTVIDKRDQGGRLWVIGEKNIIEDAVNEAITKYTISGKYANCREYHSLPGWYSKTDK